MSVAGFLSAVCFTLFFWSQFLHGTADWLEILLFVVGFICVLVEIFAIPGFGAFGVGGLLMMAASIILASQTFVIPANSYQLRQLPYSLSLVITVMFGAAVTLFVLRKYLPHTPFFKNMILQPPQGEALAEISAREALTHWEHLAGKLGATTTPLTPSGKARFGDEVIDVISDGELLPAGAKVRVIEVRGSRVLVEAIESADLID